MYAFILNRYVKVSQRDLIKAWGLPQGNFYNIPKSQIKSESSLAFPSHQLSESPKDTKTMVWKGDSRKHRNNLLPQGQEDFKSPCPHFLGGTQSFHLPLSLLPQNLGRSFSTTKVLLTPLLLGMFLNLQPLTIPADWDKTH